MLHKAPEYPGLFFAFFAGTFFLELLEKNSDTD
jgi:hypothetical protein